MRGKSKKVLIEEVRHRRKPRKTKEEKEPKITTAAIPPLQLQEPRTSTVMKVILDCGEFQSELSSGLSHNSRLTLTVDHNEVVGIK